MTIRSSVNIGRTFSSRAVSRDRLSAGLAALRPRAIGSALGRLSPAMWFLHAYLMFEYVRPQSIWESLDVAPWSLICLIGAFVLSLAEGRFRFDAKGLWACILAFSLIIVASAVQAYSPAASWADRNVWLNWLLLMLIVGAGIRTVNELIVFLMAFGLWNLKMSQHGVQGFVTAGFGFRAIGVGGAPGWFRNSGEFGIEMCIFLPLLSYFAIGLWPRLGKKARIILVSIAASALISIVASSSRGALLGIAVVAFWVMLRSRHRVKATVVVVTVGAAIWAIVPAESKQRFSEAGEDRSSTTRLTYWKHGIEIANAHPLLGIGYKNWLPFYTTNYNPNGQLPHNFMIEAVAETGYTGALCVLVLIGTSFATTSRVRRRCRSSTSPTQRLLYNVAHGLDGALIGFIVSGSFVSVLYYPFLWMNVAMVMALVRVEATERRLMGRDAVIPSRSASRELSSLAVGT